MTIIIYILIIIIIAFILACFIIIFKIKTNNNNIDYFTSDKTDQIGIYYINMDKSKDRLIHMKKQLKEQDLIGIRQNGIDGKKIDLYDKKYKFFLRNLKTHFIKNPDRIGHLGCFLSHLDIYRKFLNSPKKYCLILEDDTSFLTKNFKIELNNSIKRFSTSNWDIILFGYHIDQDWNKKHKNNNRDLFLKDNIIHNINYFTGLHCYLINRFSAKKILKKLSQPNWYIDWEISKLAYKKQLKIYGIFPPLVCQPAAFKVNINDINYRYKCKFFKTTTNNDKYVEPIKNIL
jgi:glycosyl transferase family 25